MSKGGCRYGEKCFFPHDSSKPHFKKCANVECTRLTLPEFPLCQTCYETNKQKDKKCNNKNCKNKTRLKFCSSCYQTVYKSKNYSSHPIVELKPIEKKLLPIPVDSDFPCLQKEHVKKPPPLPLPPPSLQQCDTFIDDYNEDDYNEDDYNEDDYNEDDYFSLSSIQPYYPHSYLSSHLYLNPRFFNVLVDVMELGSKVHYVQGFDGPLKLEINISKM
jgi:hypothetical protein